MLVLDGSALPRRRREPGIGGDLPAIIEVPEQPFRVEDGGTLGADTLEITDSDVKPAAIPIKDPATVPI